jgi:hypothetical protein
MHDPVIGIMVLFVVASVVVVVFAVIAAGDSLPASRASQLHAMSSQLPPGEWRTGCGFSMDRAWAAGTAMASKTTVTNRTTEVRIRRMTLSSQKISYKSMWV